MIKCKLLKKGIIKQENYTTFTTTLAKSIQLVEIEELKEIKTIYSNGQPIVLYIDCNDYKLNESDVNINKLKVNYIHQDNYLALINLYNTAEGKLKEQLGQLGVTFIINLLPPTIDITDYANNFEADF